MCQNSTNMKRQCVFGWFVAALASLTILSACEKVITLDDLQENRLVVNGLARVGDPFAISVTRSSNVGTSTTTGFASFWTYYKHGPDSTDFRNALVKDAQVALTVNGNAGYTMTYNAATERYECDYVPAEGDKLQLTVTAIGYSTASASVTVPAAEPLDEVDATLIYKPQVPFSLTITDISDFGASDTSAVLTLNLRDIYAERNYFLLTIRSSSARYVQEENRDAYSCVQLDSVGYAWTTSDIFFSTDPLLMDDRLTSGFGGWSAYLTNLFDDHLFDQSRYELHAEIPLRTDRSHRQVRVELQTLSPDLYYYLQSYMLYRIQSLEPDAYSEGVQIYSNITNGFGILGAMSHREKVFAY